MSWEKETGRLQVKLDMGFSSVSSHPASSSCSEFPGPDVALSSDPTWLHNALGPHLAGKSERSLCRSPSKHSVMFHRLISKPVGMVEECDGQWAYPVPALPLSQGGGD